MFFDWLSIYQDFDFDLPYLANEVDIRIDTSTGEPLSERQPAITYEGSYSTSISIRISGRRITVKGNPSRVNRLDNLFGFTDIDDCVSVYNSILHSLGLPRFTKNTCLTQVKTGTSKFRYLGDGAVITELHVTTNKSVGKGNVTDYIKGLSGQRYRNSIPRLHPNGCTLDWLSKNGNAPLIYADVYDKHNEILLHTEPKIKRKFGENSKEYQRLKQVINYVKLHGVARFEQKLKSRYLRRESLQFWGLSDYTKLTKLHNEFLNIDEKLEVTSMDFETISQTLQRKNICKSTLSANSTSNYAIMWMHGRKFDLSKSHIKRHRARLRQIGIDIAEPCDITRFSPVTVKKSTVIDVQDLAIPEWYQLPSTNHLKLVA